MIKTIEYNKENVSITQCLDRPILTGAIEALDEKLQCYPEKALKFEVPQSVNLLIQSYFNFHIEREKDKSNVDLFKLKPVLIEGNGNRKFCIYCIYEKQTKLINHVAIAFLFKKTECYYNERINDKETEIYSLDEFIDYQLGRSELPKHYQYPISKIDIDWYNKKSYRGCQKEIADFYNINEPSVSKWIASLRNGKATKGTRAKLHDFFISNDR